MVRARQVLTNMKSIPIDNFKNFNDIIAELNNCDARSKNIITEVPISETKNVLERRKTDIKVEGYNKSGKKQHRSS